MKSPHEQLVCAKQILSGEFFAPTNENHAIERALASMDCLVRFRFTSLTLRKRYANEHGTRLLKDLEWLLDGESAGGSHSPVLTEFVEVLGRSAQETSAGARVHPHHARPSTAVAQSPRADSQTQTG